MQPSPVGSVVRVWLRADDNPERVGHLAQIAKSHPDKGMHAKLVTTAVSDAHWLPLDRKGVLWDWLPNLRVRHPRISRMCTCATGAQLHTHWTHCQVKVTYLEGDEDDETELPTGEKSIFTGQVVNCDLEKMLIHVRWPNGDGDDWVSLLEDDWEWIDGGRPSKAELAAALKRRKIKKDSQPQPESPAAAAGSGPPPRPSPPPPPPPPRAVDLKVDSTERSQHLCAAVKTLAGPSPQLAANVVRKCSGYGVHEVILLMQIGAVSPLVRLLTHAVGTAANPNLSPNLNPNPNPNLF